MPAHLFLSKGPRCRRADLYSIIHLIIGPTIKVRRPREGGPIVLDNGPVCTRLTLTDKGNRAVELPRRVKEEVNPRTAAIPSGNR